MGVRVVFPDMGKDPSIQLIEKTITENGTYDAITDGANGYSKVNVNVEGGGGETWNTVFEGSVTTEETPRGNIAQIAGYYISADNIKVTFNGTEYECPKISVESANAYGGFNESTQDFDFSEYPFAIMSATEDGNVFFNFYTQTAGTYTLKIEEPQSGGGTSDFSTANLTITRGDSYDGRIYVPYLKASPAVTALFSILNVAEGTNTYEVVVYSGGTVLSYDGTNAFAVSGDIQAMGGGIYLITGDCTITIS